MGSSVLDFMRFWGKAQPQDDRSVAWHPLVWHCLDVAAVAEVLLDRDDAVALDLASRSGATVAEAKRFLICLTALHDIGKFSLGFQAKVRDCFPSSVLDIPATPKIGDHPAIGQHMLGEPEFAPLWDRLAPRFGETARTILASAVAGHHGRPASPARWVPDEIGQKAIAAALAFFAEVINLLAGGGFPGQLDEKAVRRYSWRLAGFVNLADWIGSNQRVFGYELPDIAMADYWRTISQPRAQRAVAEAGLKHNAISAASGFKALTGRSEAPSPLQAFCETIEGLGDGPSFFLIEDMTGAGKTEAALILAHRLMQAGRGSGIFIALPTQATANAMYSRLGGVYRRLFDDAAQPSLALSHGAAKLHDGFQDSILDVGDAKAAYARAGDDDVTASAACAAWIGTDRRRSVFADVGVGTIDQAFLSVLPVKFAALRMLGLSSKILILDEIHAYGAYEAEELRRLVEFHAARGGSIIALSATLPQTVKGRLVEAWRNGLRAKGEAVSWLPDYPMIARIDGAGCVGQCPVDPRSGLARTVRVERLDDADAALAAIAEAVALGASVAWIRNTVDDVLAGAAALEERGIPATIFHARFAMCDRQRIEAEVIAALGPPPTSGERRGRVVVASQVIEQSIDVDFDLMISDLAPVDLLIQRAGRLWRHARDNRPLPEPHLLVVSPDPDGQIEADWLSRSLRGTSYVYGNHALMWQTAKVLFAAGAIVSPSGIRPLVEAVYAADALERAPKTLERSRFDAEGQASADRAYAGMNLLRVGDGYSFREEWSPEIHTPTRTGEERTIFRLARWDGAALTPWAGPIDAGMTPREIERLWALSEVAVSRRRAMGRGDYPAEIEHAAKALEATWGEGGCLVLPLSEIASERSAYIRKSTGGVAPVVYSSVHGLRLIPEIELPRG